ncbi:MAG: SDR family oxidoreductase [Bacteroidota bacterium]|nr:SDR family oxidoreductase [Bacteroidota bacterium]MDP4232482.1 SDR family oxidoreductase [Bacteroidota bacterium]MDP4241617.1 SDR family oxidoreductase [Bacteroidota bacterium]MDP4286361.1 SDR family oxidoreductase [Bacteroidota bacterium]
MNLFKGKSAIITGAASGIGRAAASGFAREGSNVAVLDVSDAEGQKTVEMLLAEGGHAKYFHCDVSDGASVKKAIDAVFSAFGSIDYAFNNAGIEGESSPTADCTEDNWDRVLDINLKGVWLCMKYELPYMLKQGKGVIVNCSSIGGLVGFAGAPAYTASKHGLLGLTKAAALDYVKQGIRVNAICPGVIDTPMVERSIRNNPGMEALLTAGEPIGRIGKPEEIANGVVWLCSDAASFVTGIALPVDGGWVAQ